MGTWLNSDGLYLKYGTTKTTANSGGDYLSYGETREIEIIIDLTTLTTTPVIQNDTLFFGAGYVIESVETVADVAATGGTSVSVGLMAADRSSVISNTAFLAAAVIADHDGLGEKKIYTAGVATAGAYVGTVSATTGYITALAAGTYTLGKLRVRIKYRGVPPITQ